MEVAVDDDSTTDEEEPDNEEVVTVRSVQSVTSIVLMTLFRREYTGRGKKLAASGLDFHRRYPSSKFTGAS